MWWMLLTLTSAMPGADTALSADQLRDVSFLKSVTSADGRVVDEGVRQATGWHTLIATELQIQIHHPENPEAPWEPVEPSVGFKTGQRFRVQIKPLTDLYCYILSGGPGARPEVLFPKFKAGERAAPIRRGEATYLPGGSDVFRFAGPPGTETLRFLLCTREVPWEADSELWEIPHEYRFSREERALMESAGEALAASRKGTVGDLRSRGITDLRRSGSDPVEVIWDRQDTFLSRPSPSRGLEIKPTRQKESLLVTYVSADPDPVVVLVHDLSLRHAP